MYPKSFISNFYSAVKTVVWVILNLIEMLVTLFLSGIPVPGTLKSLPINSFNIFYRGGTRITSGTHIIKSSYGQCRNIFFFDIDFMQFLRNIDAYRKGSASVMPSVFTPIAPAIRMYFEAAGDSALYSMTYGNSKALDRRTST